MVDRQKELARLIESIVGGEHVITEPSIEIDGCKPALLIKPGSCEEVARCLKACADANAAAIPAGSMTWLECGNPLRRADVVLSLERMSRVIEYSSADLTATVEAGMTLSEFNSITMRDGQWLPLDPPGASCASLGAIAACDASGAMRFGYGTSRDYVIGLKLAHADGSESKSGGRVVKNVAGYDMNKLYVGSYGTLAVITELTFKLRPLPEASATVLVRSKYRGPLFLFAKRLMASELRPVSVVLTNQLSPDTDAPPSGDNGLLIRFMESETAVKHQIDWVMRAVDGEINATELGEDESGSIWLRINEWHTLGRIALKVSMPLSAVATKFEEALQSPFGCVAAADIGTGIIRMAFDADDDLAIKIVHQLRNNVARVGGAVIIERAPVTVKQRADAWGDVGATAKLMQSIKAKFDPKAILNPGRFVAGI
ncbi:MAG TPA: FAD-binding oxidoreductase [Blastocatellia bacterium]|nr:FAD-binding oxidoreductase [Blastocatellia bacterium]